MDSTKRLLPLIVWLMTLSVSVPAIGETFVGDRDDFRDETIYFAMTTRFYDGDPKNNVLSWDKQDVQIANNDPDWRGDFAGLIEKLDYIKALGFTAVWITPVTQNASGEDYHGYHSMDFSKVDLRYESRTEWGSEKDVKFQDLIDAAHKKGMKIILDIVLNHTSNFGEATLNPLFTRDQNIRNQASPATSLIPNPDRFGSDYFEQDGNKQYTERFKFFKNPNYDVHNYYHHYGTGWNWDLPNRWWGQIAGDCVDLNTENDVVAQHLVKCYGEFIKMGVDGFRIDTTGHISRLTFNTQFIPEFIKLAEQYKDKRTDGGAFFMFGECCARFGSVIYRDQHNLSSHFYTWKSNQADINSFKEKSTQQWWDTQKLNEGHDTPVGPMITCESEKTFNKNSKNVFMQNGAWHEPDYTEYSGFSVIDFPMHYNFNNAGSAVNIAKQGDQYYNDASYNVVYVDSHDYSPQPNDGIRFNGGTDQWAENLSLMFTFRGIPCIYYGSEVEFKKGKPIDVGGENNKTPRKESGRAYFGTYLEGNVTASDFGVYQATGNVAKTLNADLAQHIIRLNKIRAAVPALRKGQYTWDGCSANGGWAFKRAYKDSYALVAINGGATFNNLPAGKYVDLVTGQSYNATQGGSITVTAPTNKGQLRVLVKDWTGGKVGEDGRFIYANASVPKGGSVSFEDAGTKEYYTKADAVQPASVILTPNGGNFRSETLAVTAELNSEAASGWYKIGNGAQISLTPGAPATFTIGSDMSFGQTVKVDWSATGKDGSERTGSASYKKVDPNAAITVYVKANSAPFLYVWSDEKVGINGAWPGNQMNQKMTIADDSYFYKTFDEEEIHVILSDGSQQTADIKGLTSDTYFIYNGGTSYQIIDAPVTAPAVVFTPNGGSFRSEELDVTATLNSEAISGWYKVGNAGQVNMQPKTQYQFTLNETSTVSWSATDGSETSNGNVTFTKVDPSQGITIYCKASTAPHLYVWDDNKTEYNGGWPGTQMSATVNVGNVQYYHATFQADKIHIIFNNGSGTQTDDIKNITTDKYYSYSGGKGYSEITDPSEGGSENDDQVTYNIYFRNGNETNWSNVMLYVWDDADTKYLGDWPGTKMDYLSDIAMYHKAFSTPRNISGLKCIFNENGQNGDLQTGNFDVVNDGIYTKSGYKMSGVVDVNGVLAVMTAWAQDGLLFVESDKRADVLLFSVDGKSHQLHLEPGLNIFGGIDHGFYILGKTKIKL